MRAWFRARGRGVLIGALAAGALAGCGGLSGIPPVTIPPASSTTVPTGTTAPPTSTTAPSTSTTAPATTVPPATTTTTTTTVPTTTTTEPVAASGPTLSPGDQGPSVLALQERLASLGYWLGTPDGYFGDSTEQAVFALQKAAGLPRDGIVGPRTRAALARGVVPVPRSTSGDVVDVDLADDLLMIVEGGKLYATLNTSTGGGYVYYDQGVAAIAETPVGVFHVYTEVDGLVVDSLGELWRPKYFYSGFAIHGDSSVPPVPVSHGCVRVSNEAIDWIWAADLMPLGTEVWIY